MAPFSSRLRGLRVLRLIPLRADSTWKTYELPCGHDVMVDMPEQLFAILLERA
jgi:hypothetical protein